MCKLLVLVYQSTIISLCVIAVVAPVFKIRSETCRTKAQFCQNLYMTKKESLVDRRNFFSIRVYGLALILKTVACVLHWLWPCLMCKFPICVGDWYLVHFLWKCQIMVTFLSGQWTNAVWLRKHVSSDHVDMYMGQVMKLQLSCYLVLLSIDSKTR